MKFIDYLIDRCSITVKQIEEALDLQERHGGSLSDKLYSMKLVSEAELLGAVEACYGWRTIELTGLNIPDKIINSLPAEIAWEQKVLPFSEDSDFNTIRIGCENPDDVTLLNLLGGYLKGRKIELYATVESILSAVIISHYKIDSDFLENIKRKHAPVIKSTDIKTIHEIEPNLSGKKRAYIISPDWEVDRYLGSALVQEGYDVIMATSPVEVMEEITVRQPEIVLIRKADYGDDQYHLGSIFQSVKGGIIRQYESTSELLDITSIVTEPMTHLSANLHLFTSALAKGLNLPLKKAVKVGPLVERLCKRLNLEPRDRMKTVIAGYLQDVSTLCFKDNPSIDRETAFFMLQATAGDELVYPPVVLNVIRKMYTELPEKTVSLKEANDIRNSNIVTIVDYYLRNFTEHDKLIPNKYDEIETCLKTQVNSLLLPDVTYAFLELLKEDLVRPPKGDISDRALILDEINLADNGLNECLISCGFECTFTNSIDKFLNSFFKIKPDILIVSSNGSTERVGRYLRQITAKGIVLSELPSFVLHTSENHDKLTDFLKLGLHDVVSVKNSFDILKLRLHRISLLQEEESRQRLSVLQDMGTHGTLEHMNVIDLLQAMGPSNKTLCINVTAKSKHLMMYLHKGQLHHALCDEKTGAAAIYEALNWERGIWSVDQISLEELPESNVMRSIDSILIEGCHLLDEFERDKPTNSQADISTSPPSFPF